MPGTHYKKKRRKTKKKKRWIVTAIFAFVKRPKVYIYSPPKKKKRPGVHSKNASRNQTAYKKKYRGQGRI